jgi:hypothetical protein
VEQPGHGDPRSALVCNKRQDSPYTASDVGVDVDIDMDVDVDVDGGVDVVGRR